MTIPASFNTQLIDFSRLVLMDKATRAPYGLVIYPLTNLRDRLLINVTSTVVNLMYITNTTVTYTVSYVGKTAAQVAIEINALPVPVQAKSALEDSVLASGDLYLPSASTYFQIPEGFRVHDRVSDNGIIVRSNKYTVKHKNIANFRLLQPYSQSVYLPWYPVISNGQFVQKFREKVYHYGIPEYESQLWSIRYGWPFKDVLAAPLRRIGEGAYKLPRAPIFWNGENILLYNNETPVVNSVIEDVDTANGIIYTSSSALLEDSVRADFTYLENNFEYRGININAHFSQNPILLDKFVVIFAKPIEGSDFYRSKKTIGHIVSSSVEEGIENIEKESVDIPYVIIGGYNIQNVGASDRIKIFDTRALGGGLISNMGLVSPVHSSTYGYTLDANKKAKPIEESYRESSSFWDIGNWDGEIYPGAAAISISVPDSAKDTLSKTEITDRVTKFVAAGVYPVINYYKEELPAISGRSAQISLLMNGSLVEAYKGESGVAWMAGDRETPGSALTGSWPNNFIEPVSITPVEGTGVLITSPQVSVRQSYLKSTPIAGLQYYSREFIRVSGAHEDEILYKPWKKTTLKDKRTVPDGWLTKGYVEFNKTPNSVEVKDIRVHSPFRTDFTGQFKSHLSTEIQNISAAVSGRTVQYTTQGFSGLEITVSPIKYGYGDLQSRTLANYNGYFGASQAYNYLFETIDSDLEAQYSGRIDQVGEQVLSSLTGQSGIEYMMFYDSNYGYQNFDDPVESGLDMANAIKQACEYIHWKGQVAGYSSAAYTGMRGKMSRFISRLTGLTSGSYLPKTYTIHDSTGVAYYTPENHVIPSAFGFSEAEVNPSYNTDFDFLYMNPAVCSAALLTNDYGSATASAIQPVLANAQAAANLEISRSRYALTGLRTYSGLPVVQHWYVPYNRYGTYMGSVCRQLIDSYEYLKKSQLAATNVTFDGQGGLDVETLDGYFSGIETVLENGFTGVAELLLKNGVIEPGVADTVYAYGWYAKNRDTHVAYRDSYEDFLGAGAVHVTKYSGLFHTGLYTLVKGMTTTNSSMMEAPIIDGDLGPFNPAVPTKIIDTLAMACKLDRHKYLPLAQAVFNTLTGNYSLSGAYWVDPLKIGVQGGNEDFYGELLTRLYKAL